MTARAPRLTLLLVPGEGGGEGFPAWMGESYRAFAEAVAAALGVPVRTLESGLDAAPREGYLLVAEPGLKSRFEALDGKRRAALAPRLVPLEIPAGDAFELLAAHPIPAAVEAGGFAHWRTGQRKGEARPVKPSRPGLIGLKALAATLGGIVSYEDKGHAMIAVAGLTLPELLARYLEAYAARAEHR